MSSLPTQNFVRPGAPAVERAGQDLKRALAEGDSALSPGAGIWTARNAQELLERFNGQPDIGGSSFDIKLAGQLDGASVGAIQLFAELFVLDLLLLDDYKPATKHALITSTLALGNLQLEFPDVIEDALATGVISGGVAFKTRRYQQLCYLIDFAVAFTTLEVQQRRSVLADPLEFRTVLDTEVRWSAPSQRATLLYLFFPGFYLPIASVDHQRLIRSAFAGRLGRPTGDIDEDLRAIYDSFTAETDGPVDLYLDPYREQWHPERRRQADAAATAWEQFLMWCKQYAQTVDLDTVERSYKLVMAERLDAARTALVDGSDRWPDLFKAALGYGNLLNQFTKTKIFNMLAQHPDQLRAALLPLWSDDPDPAQFEALLADLKGLGQITPGEVVTLGSLLLMARDSAIYPPYRPTPVSRALKLTATSSTGSKPVERYRDLLDLCDQMIERGPAADLDVRDRLDAQGILWTVVSAPAPDAWEPADRAAFLRWRGDHVSTEPRQRRAWLVRGNNVNGIDLVPGWRVDGRVTLAAKHLEPVDAGISKDELKPIVESSYSFASYAARHEKLDDFHHFLSVMDHGDVLVTIDQGRLFLGEISGDVEFVAGSSGTDLQRSVVWAAGEGLAVEVLPAELQPRLAVPRDVLDLTQQLEALEALITAGDEPSPGPVDVVAPAATAELAAELHVAQEWLQKCIDLLNDRPQLILYGPPGTGKTFIAQRLAKHIAGDHVRLVQFHPAYAYEDFFEGFRPKADGGFELTGGPMRRVVDQAVANPAVPHVLIIDEINRGNLAKVFGELYFLLEYRGHNVELLYSKDDFSLPKNIFIIGTMNTADRSIALVDAAMRRRFAFLPLHPSEPPTSGILRSWLLDQEPPLSTRTADLLEALNGQIQDQDFKIGPSYFMRGAVHRPGGLELAWETAILPLLEEHHYGELDRVAVAEQYGLSAISRIVDRTTGLVEPDGDDGAAPDPA